MKHFLGGLLVATAIAAGTTSVVAAADSDFTIDSFHADYYLGADKEGRSTLKSVESIVADFPASDQSHGIRRLIAKNADGHPTDLTIKSITDGKGKSIFYALNDSADGDLIIQVGDPSRYVHGWQTYVITYTQRDVTSYLKDVPDDEFGRDVTGTAIAQPIGTVSATVHLSDAIQPTFTKKASCDAGSAACQVVIDGSTVTLSTTSVHPYQNIAFKAGFTPGTFRGYEQSFWYSSAFLWCVAAVTILVAAMGTWLLRHFFTQRH